MTHRKCPYKRETEGDQTYGSGGSASVEAGDGMMQPQTEECQQPREAGKEQEKDLCLEPPEGTWSC